MSYIPAGIESAIYTLPAIDFPTAIMIVLTALAVILTALAVGVGLFAFFGYTTLRDGVKETAKKHVDSAMDMRMKAYPEPQRLFELCERMEEIVGGWDDLKNQIVNAQASKDVAPTSKPSVKDSEETGEKAEVAPPYPEKER